MWKFPAIVVAIAASSLTLRADEPIAAVEVVEMNLWEFKLSEPVSEESDRRREMIELEIQTGAVPDWAGAYYGGDGLGKNVYLVLAPQGGFTYSWAGCLGTYDQNYGSVTADRDGLALTFELANNEKLFGTDTHFVPVRWGERRYLLTDGEVKPFINAVNSGYEPCGTQCGRFLMRRGDDKLPVTGRPELPETYRQYFLDYPIAARIARVLNTDAKSEGDPDFGWRTTTVEIDVGREDGVWEGMELYPGLDTYTGSGFEVRSVGDRKSIAVVTESVYKGEPPLEPGLCLSTMPDVQTCPIAQTAALR